MVTSTGPKGLLRLLVCSVGVLGIRTEKPPSREVNSFHAGSGAARTLADASRAAASPRNRTRVFIAVSFAALQHAVRENYLPPSPSPLVRGGPAVVTDRRVFFAASWRLAGLLPPSRGRAIMTRPFISPRRMPRCLPPSPAR